jgi:hypothetical protein
MDASLIVGGDVSFGFAGLATFLIETLRPELSDWAARIRTKKGLDPPAAMKMAKTSLKRYRLVALIPWAIGAGLSAVGILGT